MLRFVWPLLLCFAIPCSAWMGPVLVGGTVPTVAASPLCDGTEVYCVEWAGAGTTSKVLNDPSGANDDVLDSLTGNCYREDESFNPGYNAGPRSDGDAFGGSHYMFCDGGGYVTKGSVSWGDHWYYIKFRPEKSSTATRHLYGIGSTVGRLRAQTNALQLTVSAFTTSSLTDIGDPYTLTIDTVYQLLVYYKPDAATGSTSWKLYSSAGSLLASGGPTTVTATVAIDTLRIGAEVSNEDMSFGLIKVTSSEPSLVP